jgi:hypothetical protein
MAAGEAVNQFGATRPPDYPLRRRATSPTERARTEA